MDVSKPLSLCLPAWNLIISMLMGVQASHRILPEFQSLSATTVRQLHRTAYHFQPPMHWINGPMYYKGFYHLFYQYNPKGSVWGNIIWAHSVSKDLVVNNIEPRNFQALTSDPQLAQNSLEKVAAGPRIL
ncbi:hypothetical protein HRI_000776300 [Hibiscus trionum]|uniref:Glycosyl hydrolase family 32 N-terminal domain-containing protein n=1 Tax=Hibiscus trionum TaxID=183268 RepID=A0A9W7H4W9_HIBTR|nr:hypothetical protein HRI_000776300 [Hibiscus trionum]